MANAQLHRGVIALKVIANGIVFEPCGNFS
jgi:hypothetical protein